MNNIRIKSKIKFIEFVRPGPFPYPYTIEQAFHVFQWFVRTGEKRNKYGHCSTWDLLDCRPTCINHDMWTDRISSIDNLKKRFHYVLLYDDSWNSLTTAWKKDNGIGLDTAKVIYFNHHQPFEHDVSERMIEASLTKLLTESHGKKLKVSLNDCHPNAKWIDNVAIRVLPDSFGFVMLYGYKHDNSGWDYILAETENNEPFTDTLFRAIKVFNDLTVK